MNTTAEKKTRRTQRNYSAGEKATAVLSVWSGRRRTARVCRELSVPWGLLRSWEKSAIRGIRMALGDLPDEAPPVAGALSLGKRMETLLGEREPPPAAVPEGIAQVTVKE